ncbi:MAG: hypothetical protein F6K48_02880 [Okeania sp. SIO3H1]|nr:hypothetical protein [Okeania sp. SIO3H1]
MYGLFVDDGIGKDKYPKEKLLMTSDDLSKLKDIVQGITGLRTWTLDSGEQRHEDNRCTVREIVHI